MTDEITILAERPDTANSSSLISELEEHLEPLYPSESRHGYSIEKLLKSNVFFFVLYCNGVPAGCGGVQFYDGTYGELKRMYVRPVWRGRGLAKRMLLHLEDHTRQHGITLVRLETGIHQHEAICLYERMGYYRIPPFGAYTDDPLSVFYEKRLDGTSPTPR